MEWTLRGRLGSCKVRRETVSIRGEAMGDGWRGEAGLLLGKAEGRWVVGAAGEARWVGGGGD